MVQSRNWEGFANDKTCALTTHKTKQVCLMATQNCRQMISGHVMEGSHFPHVRFTLKNRIFLAHWSATGLVMQFVQLNFKRKS